jgi:hypothetical protein
MADYKLQKVQPNGKAQWVKAGKAATGTLVTDFAKSVPMPKARKPK